MILRNIVGPHETKYCLCMTVDQKFFYPGVGSIPGTILYNHIYTEQPSHTAIYIEILQYKPSQNTPSGLAIRC